MVVAVLGVDGVAVRHVRCAGCGLVCADMTNDVYFQIGLVTLLGLAAKNAILIVEYASLKASEGYSTAAAAIEAARLRFRPIVMTSLAFILGVVPLALLIGCRRGRARLGGYRRDGRHAGGDIPGDLLRAAVLQADHRSQVARNAQRRRAAGRSGRRRTAQRRRCTRSSLRKQQRTCTCERGRKSSSRKRTREASNERPPR